MLAPRGSYGYRTGLSAEEMARVRNQPHLQELVDQIESTDKVPLALLFFALVVGLTNLEPLFIMRSTLHPGTSPRPSRSETFPFGRTIWITRFGQQARPRLPSHARD